MHREWDELQPRFRRLVARRGVAFVARAVPLHRATVYRIIGGTTRQPQPCVVRCIDQLLRSETKPPEEPKP